MDEQDAGIFMSGTPGFTHRLVVHSATDWRVLVSVDAAGTITMPDDLTIEEARSVIEQLVPLVAPADAPEDQGAAKR